MEKQNNDELNKMLDGLQINKNEEKKSNEEDDDLDMMDQLVQQQNKKLNISVNEKDEHEEIDDEAIEKEFNNFMKEMQDNQQTKELFGQLNQMMQNGFMNENDDFLNNLDGEGGFDQLSDQVLNHFVDKNLIYEPLQEAQKQIQELMKDEQQQTDQNKEKLQIINSILEILDKGDKQTDQEKQQIITLFEKLNDKGGLPDEIVKKCMKENPQMEQVQNMQNQPYSQEQIPSEKQQHKAKQNKNINKDIKSFEYYNRQQYNHLKKNNSDIQEYILKQNVQEVKQKQSQYVEKLYKSSYYVMKTKELLFQYIRKIRERSQNNQLFLDQTYNEFANQLITQNQKGYQIMLENFNKFYGYKDCSIQRITFQYKFQEDYENLEGKNFNNLLQDIIILLEENKQDQNILQDKIVNSFGLQVEYQEKYMKFEIIFGLQKVQISKIIFNNQKLRLKGKIMQQNRGLYAIKVFDHKQDKQIAVINPQHIIFENDQTFQINYKFTQTFQNRPILQFYLNEDFQSIKYGKKSQQKYIPKSLEIEYTIPLLKQFQQPELQLNEDIQQIINKPINQKFRCSIKQKINLNQIDQEESEESSSEQSSYDSFDQIQFKQLESQNTNEQNQQKEDDKLRAELEISIQEAQEDLILQSRKNQKLSEHILQYVRKKKQNDKLNDDTLEINYYNMIGLIYNSQQDLEIMNKDYSTIKEVLSNEIQQKQQQFENITQHYLTFLDKIIQTTKFQSKQQKQRYYDLIQQDKKLNKELQDERVELARLRLQLKRQKETYEKQEVLGQDLHLIDLEKLKIENQQLNEKIQNRTQEIFRLNKKNMQNIHILAHLEAKLSTNTQQVEQLDQNYNLMSILKRKKIHKKQEVNFQI